MKLEKSTFVLILVLSLLKLIIHLYTNGFAGYGIFRDELYYLSCASRPDLGYVDQPPFSIWILVLIRFVIGDSVFAIRFLPALLGAATVLMLGLMVKKMEGGKLAVLVSSLALIFAPIFLGMNTFYSMNSFDIFLWIQSKKLTNGQDFEHWRCIAEVDRADTVCNIVPNQNSLPHKSMLILLEDFLYVQCNV